MLKGISTILAAPILYLRDKLSTRQFFILSSILVGLSSGLAAILLKSFVHSIETLVTFYSTNYEEFFLFALFQGTWPNIFSPQNYKKQDEDARERVEAKNKLENYAYSVRNATNEDAVKDKLSADDKATINTAIDDALKWLDHNQSAQKEEFDHQMSELEGKLNPIMTKLHQAGAGGMPEGGAYAAGGPRPSGTGAAGPTVEEVD